MSAHITGPDPVRCLLAVPTGAEEEGCTSLRGYRSVTAEGIAITEESEQPEIPKAALALIGGAPHRWPWV